MTQELRVLRSNLRQAEVVDMPSAPLEDGQIRLAIREYALTANNVTYAVAGDLIGYWQYYPADQGWGRVPVWGLADIVESRCPDLAVGERIYGFYPMATDVVLTPGSVRPGRFVDISTHRQALPPLYNSYQRTAGEPQALQALGELRCLLMPLLVTSWLLADYLESADCFGATRILIGSASSKTALGLANLLYRSGAKEVVGLTSAVQLPRLRPLHWHHQLIPYDALDTLEPGVPTVLVDMSGSGTLVDALAAQLGPALRRVVRVGITHWDAQPGTARVAGLDTFFFAPEHIARREAEWGSGSVMPRAATACAEIAAAMRDFLVVQRLQGLAAGRSAWLDLLDNAVPAHHGLMVEP